MTKATAEPMFDNHEEQEYSAPGGIDSLFSQPTGYALKTAINQSPFHNDDGCSLIIPFPRKLHQMLEDSEKDGFTSIVSWLPASSLGHSDNKNDNNDGRVRSFKVHDPDSFVSTIMPRYFKQTQYRSFQRQLNIWGFCRLHHPGLSKGAYSHPLFVRGEPSLCNSMQRQLSATKKKRSRRRPSKKSNQAIHRPATLFCESPPDSSNSGRNEHHHDNDDNGLSGNHESIFGSIEEILRQQQETLEDSEGLTTMSRDKNPSSSTSASMVSGMLLNGYLFNHNNNHNVKNRLRYGQSSSLLPESESSPSVANEACIAAPHGEVTDKPIADDCIADCEPFFSEEEEEAMSRWGLDQVSMDDSLLSAIMTAEEEHDDEMMIMNDLLVVHDDDKPRPEGVCEGDVVGNGGQHSFSSPQFTFPPVSPLPLGWSNEDQGYLLGTTI